MNPILLHLEKLRHFKEVAQQGSFSRAAVALGISQPSLSVSIRVLEEAIGSSLFTRSKRGTEITSAGHTLLKYTNEIFQGAKDCFENIHSEEPFSKIQFATHESLVPGLWPQIVRSPLNNMTSIDLNLVTSDKVLQCRDLVLSNECQVGITVESPAIEEDERFYTLPLFLDHLCFVAAVGSEFAKKKITSLEDLPLLYHPGMIVGGRKRLQEVMDDLRLSCSPQYSVSSINSLKAMTLTGLGVGLLPKFLLHQEFKKRLIVELKTSLPIKKQTQHKVIIFCREDFRKRLMLRELARELKKGLEK